MWNKKNEEETTPKVVSPPSGIAAPAAVRSAPIHPANPDQPKAQKPGVSIGPSMTVKGQVYSREELYVDGEIEGSIEMQHRLTVGPHGKVRAAVKAKEVVVEGSIDGNVSAAEKIIIRAKGSLVGDIKTAGIAIDDGAYFKGSIDIARTEAKRKGASESTDTQTGEMVSVRP